MGCDGLAPGPARTVARIIDGETLGLDDGTQVRLIGVLAPRAIDVGLDPHTWPPETRAREELGRLAIGKSIELRFDGETTDRYGRLQAHAFLVDAGTSAWVQGRLLQQGLARAHTTAGHRRCADELLAAEQKARTGRLGLWAEAAYQVRSAHTPAELLRYRTTFQLVEGGIERVAVVRGVIYLNFDRNWRAAFSVSLRQVDRALLGEAYARNPKGLEGKTVRVRGWVEQRGSAPVIDLSSAGTIEVLEKDPGDRVGGR